MRSLPPRPLSHNLPLSLSPPACYNASQRCLVNRYTLNVATIHD